jgi:hypothetical protein
MGARGEGSIECPDGREVKLLYTNRALAEIEKALDRSIIEVLNRFGEGSSGIRETATILRSGMEAARRDGREGGRSITLNDAYAVLDEVGFAAAASEAFAAVGAVLSYNAEGEGGDTDPNG